MIMINYQYNDVNENRSSSLIRRPHINHNSGLVPQSRSDINCLSM